MKKLIGNKTAILILGGISILVVIYLVASLGSLELKPATPFAYIQDTAKTAPGGLPTWNGLFIIIPVFAVLLLILFMFLNPEQRKKFLQALAWFILAGLLVYLFLSWYSLGKQLQVPQESPVGVVATLSSEPTDTPEPMITPSVFTPPQVSSMTSYLVALAVLLVAAGAWGWWVWRRKQKGAPYDVFADIAQSALEDIEAGQDWGDTILNSYYRMNKAVASWRGIHRQAGTTPEEFADYLVSAHLPAAAVHRLTALFERVRYGDKKSTRQDIQEAVDCLTAILEVCQAAK